MRRVLGLVANKFAARKSLVVSHSSYLVMLITESHYAHVFETVVVCCVIYATLVGED